MLVMEPENDSCGTGATLLDSGDREATQTARMTEYTGTEVGDERNLTSPPKCPTPGNSGREGPELSVVEFSVFTR